MELPPRVFLDVPKTASPLPSPGGGMQAWINSNGFTVLTVPYHADPKKDNWEWFNKAKKGLREDQFRREVLIDFTARGGQKVFPYLTQNPGKYFVKPRGEVPKNHYIVGGLDFGSRNPSAILLGSVNERGHIHVFAEFYKPSNPAEISRYLKNHPYFHRLQKIAADPSMWNKNQHQLAEQYNIITSIADMLNDMGIYQMERANNDRLSGLERIKYLFRYSSEKPDLDPYLTISEECVNLRKELEELVYKEETPEQLTNKNESEDTVKRRDHAYDGLKYLCLSCSVPSDMLTRPVAHEFSLRSIEDQMDLDYEHDSFDDLII
tara:strand:- start:486 stop:1448 length:963 start_codon:yes stop_codon:yes gene_type:complete